MTEQPGPVGPLAGLRALEIGGIGPGPYCGMLLADLGAEVIRVERHDSAISPEQARFDLVNRGRRSIRLNLKHPDGRQALLKLVDTADLLFEGHRPGVAEQLGIGPADCLSVNPRLVYGRMSGWGQEGPLAMMAGHDIDYIAISGALHPIGPAGQPPIPPLHHLGNYGGGGMVLAFGLLAAVLSARSTGHGQVVDAAMVDGTALMTTYLHGELAAKRWNTSRGQNLLDGGAPFYRSYECSDGEFVALGAIEPKFSAKLLDLLGITDETIRRDWYRPESWPRAVETVAAIIRTKTRDEWALLASGTDACLLPVLSLIEAPLHPHNVERHAFVEIDGVVQPAPAPRFSRTPAFAGTPPLPGADTDDVLWELGYEAGQIATMREAYAIG